MKYSRRPLREYVQPADRNLIEFQRRMYQHDAEDGISLRNWGRMILWSAAIWGTMFGAIYAIHAFAR